MKIRIRVDPTDHLIGRGIVQSGTPSPNLWGLSLSRQNSCFTLRTLARKTRLRRDATGAPMRGPEWAASPAAQHLRFRRALAYSWARMILPVGPTVVRCRTRNSSRAMYVLRSRRAERFVFPRSCALSKSLFDRPPSIRSRTIATI
jgi:hypothetical protein